MNAFDRLNARIVACQACPRLIEHCQRTATEKRASYRDWTYHGRPVPNLGDPQARLLIVGLAPAAHGANRTGRMFTGDRSGDFLFEAMHATGFANQPHATDVDDGLQLIDACITAAAHCAPPANKPTTEELKNCRAHLDDTLTVLAGAKVILCLGGIAFAAMRTWYRDRSWIDKVGDYQFGHGRAFAFDDAPALLCCFHPSQQNTFTGRLTQAMMQSVFRKAKEMIERR